MFVRNRKNSNDVAINPNLVSHINICTQKETEIVMDNGTTFRVKGSFYAVCKRLREWSDSQIRTRLLEEKNFNEVYQRP